MLPGDVVIKWTARRSAVRVVLHLGRISVYPLFVTWKYQIRVIPTPLSTKSPLMQLGASTQTDCRNRMLDAGFCGCCQRCLSWVARGVHAFCYLDRNEVLHINHQTRDRLYTDTAKRLIHPTTKITTTKSEGASARHRIFYTINTEGRV